jgi:hypothetical protein
VENTPAKERDGLTDVKDVYEGSVVELEYATMGIPLTIYTLKSKNRHPRCNTYFTIS